mmetsp:Transcript_48649/g.75945  ORF Transcript_48649/g.75945 Transcript_48649/m.75945 type:complete len:528 (-) Transcript_48649:58-1641(-)|eukprot:CAMPEP_0184290174 /NCGR_PEP_ID=MMETSP1049-20130417/2518_1 /TAXON_ID=77928 /ORGANISM="Proteomonas sulcata, Strain CCMP704" /LENGTH=527 /DNA_ID=CAMNT_0026597281 /DNA_START=261 /DNA_END=1844 /DNA_ORIENTATION=-
MTLRSLPLLGSAGNWLKRGSSTEKKGSIATRTPSSFARSIKSVASEPDAEAERMMDSAVARDSMNSPAHSTRGSISLPNSSAVSTRSSRRSSGMSFASHRSDEGPQTSSAALAMKDWRVGAIYTIVPGLIHFTSSRVKPVSAGSNLCFFTCDFPKQYYPFCSDFGPVNLGVIVRFCDMLRTKVKAVKKNGLELVFRTSEDLKIRTNAAFLMAAYLLLEEGYTPEEAIQPFERITPYPFKPYRDATYAPVDFELSILDCLHGLRKAVSTGWFNHRDFELTDYERWDNPENGDFHQVTPKFIAFKGPVGKHKMQDKDDYAHSPAHYGGVFREKGVSAIVRLSDPSTYSAREFTAEGIRHYDLYFDDCTTPSDELVDKFLEIADQEDGLVAVHCKAGLGRTGTVIACHVMKHYGFTAREAISWLRMARPGSVIGPQQHYLVGYEEQLMTEQLMSNASTARGGSDAGSPYSSFTSMGSKFSNRLRHTVHQHSDEEDRFVPNSEVLADQVSNGQIQRAMAREAARKSTRSRP